MLTIFTEPAVLPPFEAVRERDDGGGREIKPEASADRNDGIGPQAAPAPDDQGRSLQQVADQAEISVGLLSQIERGLTMPSLRSLRQICTALDMRWAGSSTSRGPSMTTSSSEPPAGGPLDLAPRACARSSCPRMPFRDPDDADDDQAGRRLGEAMRNEAGAKCGNGPVRRAGARTGRNPLHRSGPATPSPSRRQRSIVTGAGDEPVDFL